MYFPSRGISSLLSVAQLFLTMLLIVFILREVYVHLQLFPNSSFPLASSFVLLQLTTLLRRLLGRPNTHQMGEKLRERGEKRGERERGRRGKRGGRSDSSYIGKHEETGCDEVCLVPSALMADRGLRAILWGGEYHFIESVSNNI